MLSSPASDLPASCGHRPACPGCPRYGEGGIAQAAFRKLENFCERHGVPAPLVRQAAPAGYRHRARLAVRGSTREPRIGLFKVGTHDVVAVPDCPIHHPLINRVAALLAESLQATSTSVYSERAHSGLVRYLQVVVERSSQTAQVVVVVNSAQDTACLRLFEHLHERLGSEGHSVFFNGQPARTNAILGPHWRKHSGPDAVVETFGGAAVCYPPGAFGQSNLGLFVRIVSEIHSAVEPDAPVVELFAGVGAIGLGLARRGHSVLFNEVSPASLEGLRLGIHELPALAQTRVRCVSGEAASAVAGLEFSGAHVIVDPPRKGLGEEVLQSLLRGRPDRLTYLSCGLQSFLDDAESLVAHGFVCDRVTAYALFPFTDHVETLAQFRHARR